MRSLDTYENKKRVNKFFFYGKKTLFKPTMRSIDTHGSKTIDEIFFYEKLYWNPLQGLLTLMKIKRAYEFFFIKTLLNLIISSLNTYGSKKELIIFLWKHFLQTRYEEVSWHSSEWKKGIHEFFFFIKSSPKSSLWGLLILVGLKQDLMKFFIKSILKLTMRYFHTHSSREEVDKNFLEANLVPCVINWRFLSNLL